ncbi:uncharacterized protein LOC116342211 [Contarinia nasturtii]|uniref:uncharacterized protein LOC116342211 n=1 Tax=Contarinia nasturtii TaxID=265458 RepID=UPI0012D3EFCF|nr:uncharacterized protein LOC116342211 [Contarinia nasturtii]
MTDDLLDSFSKSTPKENMYKLFAIEETINRDKSAVAILNGMLQYARNVTTMEALENDMTQILHENEVASRRLRSKKAAMDQDIKRSDQNGASTGKLLTRSGINLKYTVKEKLYDVREMIDNHVENIHSSVTENVKQTIGYIQKWQKSNGKLMKRNGKHKVKLDKSLDGVKRLWDQVTSAEHTDFDVDYDKTLSNIDFNGIRITKGEEIAVESSPKPKVIVDTNIDRFKRQNTEKFMVEVDIDGPPKKSEKQNDDDEDNEIDGGDKDDGNKGEEGDEDFSGSSDFSEEPGGLVGLITNLSGGDEGSDFNAIIGAISQVLSNLLGPGGLDVPVVVTSGTALLASLLAGDDNFGKFLGNIVGLAIEGFSQGGAANNGQFFGQFLGKFISVLSADPEDLDNGPLQPDVFIKNVFDGIGKGSAKDAVEGDENKPDQDDGKGSDSAKFVSGLVSGIIGIITKASVGSSAGSSQGSVQGVTGVLGGSSSGSSGTSSGTSSKDDEGKGQR